MRFSDDQADTGELYLSLLKGCLTRSLFIDEHHNEPRLHGWRRFVREAVNRVEKNLDWRIVERATASAQDRHEGRDFPQTAETMAALGCVCSLLPSG